MADQSNKVLYGLYNDEEDLKAAVKTASAEHMDIMDVLTPFPVHGLDPILGLKESRLHYLGFIYGAIGALFGFLVMSWVFTRDWPIMFGGKPYWSVPAFIPITFEMTVLFSAWGMTITFYTICGMWPGVKPKILDERITDDKFCVAFNVTNASKDELEGIKGFFKKTKAAEVNEKMI
ncbi:MAG: DUF3341 domain-containing protein [Saprospiraceae bacterium]|nr:DUF3341 domain-containing protein [Saprospiraceae bacterium]MCB9343911.1 DUF3341 domain-containing protein [Lewinellaceae bacterium]